MADSPTDNNQVIVIGENPFIRLSETDEGDTTTDASFWRVIHSPSGEGHVLYIKSELTDGEVKIFSDNIGMTRWLQGTVQGMLNPSFGDLSVPVVDASFERSGDLHSFWTETVYVEGDGYASDIDIEEISLTWYAMGEPLLVHTQPNATPGRPYGVCTVLIPASGARLLVDGVQAAGKPWPRERDGRPFSTCALAFNECWTAKR